MKFYINILVGVLQKIILNFENIKWVMRRDFLLEHVSGVEIIVYIIENDMQGVLIKKLILKLIYYMI